MVNNQGRKKKHKLQKCLSLNSSTIVDPIKDLPGAPVCFKHG